MGTESVKPIITNKLGISDVRSAYPVTREVDIYDHQSAELRKIDPEAQPIETYIYYGWNQTVMRCVDDKSLFTIRTNRNKNLISAEEQDRLAAAKVGVAGMSVGAGIAIGLAYSGISDSIKIADHDELDTSNLNRLRESLLSVGEPKAKLAAQHIYELNPFAGVEVFSDGITTDNIDKFFEGLDIVVDEIDDFKIKVQLRLKAKQLGIPVIMFTSLGDNILIDVERFDVDKDIPIFHGLIDDVSEEILAKSEISPEDIRKYSVRLVGQEYIPTRAVESVAEMGKTLVGRPQLYSTIAVDGGLAAFTVRKLILQSQPASGRYFVKFNDLLDIQSDELEDNERRKAAFGSLFNG